MGNIYYHESKLDCSRNNEDFTRYITDLKTLFEKAKTLEEAGDLEKSKDLIENSYGDFSPNVYDVHKEASEIFSGEFSEITKEIVLRYKEIFERLSEEDINFLTGSNVEVTKNRIKLFLMQQLRDIDSILS
jgi:hypothetical protein